MNYFGEVLSEAINDNNITVEALSELVKIPKEIIEKYINNEVLPYDGGTKIFGILNKPGDLYSNIPKKEWHTGIPEKNLWDKPLLIYVKIGREQQGLMYACYDEYGWYKNIFFNGTPLEKNYFAKEFSLFIKRWAILE